MVVVEFTVAEVEVLDKLEIEEECEPEAEAEVDPDEVNELPFVDAVGATAALPVNLLAE